MLVATLISIGVVVTVIVSALRSLGRKSGPEIPGLTKMSSPSSGLSPEQGGLASAQCYWDCMSGFHWDEDWKERCAPACDLAEKHGKA